MKEKMKRFIFIHYLFDYLNELLDFHLYLIKEKEKNKIKSINMN